MSTPPLDTEPDQDHFQHALEASLGRLQQALRDGIAGLGLPKSGPTAIGRALGLDKSIAWKIGHMTKAANGLLAFNFLPGQAGMKIVLEAFQVAEIPAELVREIEEALLQVEQDIQHHAGDRRTAATMIRATLAGAEQRPLDEGLRRDHFRTASAIWGAQARVHIKADFLAPGKEPATFDTVSFEGFDELLRLRAGISWPVGRKRVTKEGGVADRTFESLDPQFAGAEVAPLMADYCSTPLPEFDVIEDSEGFSNYILRPGAIGRTGSTTCTIGTLCENAVYAEEGDEYLNLITGVHLRTPCEVLIFDLYLHRSIASPELPTAELFGQLRLGPAFPHMREDHSLPVDFQIEELSTAPGAQSVLEIPNYSDAVTDTFRLAGGRLGAETWQRKDFIGYRVRLDYPPIPSLGNFIFKLLPKRD